ncbi:ABC transporter substrate-binding protein [Cupriavidus necator]|uniref:Ethanolamine utilization protein EutJ n=1 Tax=Cupriavidus necator TaxID=106590 RepID=A0A367PG59_CUPNE|nr:ABC transporter substrate-binding protein [Cupriavidus necator]QQX86647.1 ABC transporter substrate-binding protein [Cupriavidus necator]RCJ06839.1 ethanolamine utilization protein EutJ [Cupriavidus necator]
MNAVPLRRFAIAALAATAATPSLAQEIVNIGYTGPMSGGAALYGKNVVDGIEMAIKEINAAGLQVGGKAVQLKLVALDDKYSPAEAAVNARRLVQQSKVPAVFVPHSGGIYAAQAFNQQDKFIVMAYSPVPRITETGNKLTVRIPPSFASYIEPFSRYEQRRFGKKVGLLPGDHEYGKAWTQLFSQGWTGLGGEIAANNALSYNKSADFYSGVSRVLAAKPDVLFVGGPSEPTALVAKQARELGFKGGFIVMDQAKLDEMAKITNGLAMLEGSVGLLPLRDDDRQGPKTFVAAFAKAYGAERVPTVDSSYNYALMHALAVAMKLAGTASNAEAIHAKLDEAIKTMPPRFNSGEFRGLDAKGGTLANPRVAVIENGAIKPVSLNELK